MPDDTPAVPKPTDIALGFQITANIHDRSQIVFTSCVPLDATDAQINSALDKVLKACDRQRAKYQVEDFKLKLDLETKAMERQEQAVADRVAKLADLKNIYQSEWTNGNRRGEFKLTQQQESNVKNVQTDLENMKTTLAGMRENVEKTKKNVVETEALAK